MCVGRVVASLACASHRSSLRLVLVSVARVCVCVCMGGGGADHEAGELKVGQRVDVFDRHESRRKWCDGEVVEAKPSEVKVHFYVRACLGIGMR